MDFCFVLLYMRNFEKKVLVVVWKKTIDVDGWKNVMGIRKTSGELKSSSVANTKNKNKSFLCFVNYFMRKYLLNKWKEWGGFYVSCIV